MQDNLLRSGRGTLCGLHFQAPPHVQATLVSCLDGAVFDVAVDLCVGSPTEGIQLKVVLADRLGG